MPSDHGIVVQNKESGLEYASLDRNFDPESERKVRDLEAGETVLGYQVKPAKARPIEHETPKPTETPKQ